MPAIARCSVRGIGVAVSVSTSTCVARLLDPLLVRDAEPLLLVDHEQAEVLEPDVGATAARCVPTTTSSLPAGELLDRLDLLAPWTGTATACRR